MAQKRQYASLTSLFAQLFIELAEWHKAPYLVIDDYHLITNPVIHESMRFFIRHQPEKSHPGGVVTQPSRNWALPICVFVTNCRKWQSATGIYPSGSETVFDCRLSSPIGSREAVRLR